VSNGYDEYSDSNGDSTEVQGVESCSLGYGNETNAESKDWKSDQKLAQEQKHEQEQIQHCTLQNRNIAITECMKKTDMTQVIIQQS
jgi:hypothetical protein